MTLVPSSLRAIHPGAGSTRIIAMGPSRGCNSNTRLANASRKVPCLSSFMMHTDVNEVTVSRITTINYRSRLRTSAANDSQEDLWETVLQVIPETFEVTCKHDTNCNSVQQLWSDLRHRSDVSLPVQGDV